MPWLMLFFLTPIIEMYLLIEVAGYIDAWPTIGLVMLTAVVGVALLKRQGIATLTRGVQRAQQGHLWPLLGDHHRPWRDPQPLEGRHRPLLVAVLPRVLRLLVPVLFW